MAESICRGDDIIGHIVGDLEIVIAKVTVLLGIQHLNNAEAGSHSRRSFCRLHQANDGFRTPNVHIA